VVPLGTACVWGNLTEAYIDLHWAISSERLPASILPLQKTIRLIRKPKKKRLHSISLSLSHTYTHALVENPLQFFSLPYSIWSNLSSHLSQIYFLLSPSHPIFEKDALREEKRFSRALTLFYLLSNLKLFVSKD